MWRGKVIAESDDTVIVESNHYFPKKSLNMEFFIESDTTSYCGWKGEANYLSVVVESELNQDAAWYYQPPMEAAKEIQDRVAFWNGVEVIE